MNNILNNYKRVSRKNSIIGILIVIFDLFLYLFISKIFGYKLNFILLYILIGFIVLIIIRQLIIEYRIKKNFYGTNEDEIREILSTIQK
jgi:hypothetical protein